MVSEARIQLRRSLGRHRGAAYQAYLRTVLVPRVWTAQWRREPDYIIIGAQKCGTASLFAYLAQHPQVGRSLKKEVGYFSSHFENGYDWYRGFFPIDRKGASVFLTGEATPDYMFDPRAPRRVAERLPSAKLITLLRDPVSRAYSHYRHNVRKNNESRTFEDALRYELDYLEPRLRETGSMEARTRFVVDNRRWFYLARGRYHEQLMKWLEYFSQEQILILKSEDLFHDTDSTFATVLNFLGLDGDHQVTFDVHNRGIKTSDATSEMKSWLQDYYLPHNMTLAELLGWPMPWKRTAN